MKDLCQILISIKFLSKAYFLILGKYFCHIMWFFWVKQWFFKQASTRWLSGGLEIHERRSKTCLQAGTQKPMQLLALARNERGLCKLVLSKIRQSASTRCDALDFLVMKCRRIMTKEDSMKAAVTKSKDHMQQRDCCCDEWRCHQDGDEKSNRWTSPDKINRTMALN